MTGMTVTNFGIGSATQNPTGMQLLGTATLAAPGKTLSVTGLPARNIYLVFIFISAKAGSESAILRLNGIATGVYDGRYSSNGAADTTYINQTSLVIQPVATAGGSGTTITLINYAPGIKRIYGTTVSGGGGGNAPDKADLTGAANITATQINEIDLVTVTNNMNADTQIWVYGSN